MLFPNSQLRRTSALPSGFSATQTRNSLECIHFGAAAGGGGPGTCTVTLAGHARARRGKTCSSESLDFFLIAKKMLRRVECEFEVCDFMATARQIAREETK